MLYRYGNRSGRADSGTRQAPDTALLVYDEFQGEATRLCPEAERLI